MSNGSRGLVIKDTGPMIINCIIENNKTGITIGGLDTFLPNPIFIFNSSISRNRDIGIDTGTVGKYKILNSCISGPQNYGIISHRSGTNATNSFIKNCIFKNNTLFGLLAGIDNPTMFCWNGSIANNVFDGNGTALFVSGNAVKSFTSPAKSMNNIFVNNSTAVNFDAATNFKFDYTCFFNNGADFYFGSYSDTTVRADPRFTNTNCEDSNFGYSLQEGSPCIDA